MMRFWGLQVPKGKGATVEIDKAEKDFIHVSQAALGADSKEGERVVLQVEDGNNKPIVLGTLTRGKCDQMPLDLVFDNRFRLFHTGSGNVFLVGYETKQADEDDDEEDDGEFEDEDDDEDDEEDEDELGAPDAVPIAANGKGSAKPIAAAKRPATPAKLGGAAAMDEDEDDDEDDDEFEEEEFDEGDDDEDGDDEDDDDEDDDEEEEDVPKVTSGGGLKRPAAIPLTPKSAAPSSEKKAKLDPAVASGKKGAKSAPKTAEKVKKEVVTPAEKSTEKAAKTAASKGPKTPGAATPGGFDCDICKKAFKNEVALTQHNKSKHGP
eukprot:TRINITY_DN374_c1_g1_i1.p1 TRINITY_DN374_c1_g1~~TRINITY_DN374_c1_g1_i1.p1  ORF type:complete len:322 (+),score=117.66 TRINITY_DN374_c1_g1_i1:148-1113(+)